MKPDTQNSECLHFFENPDIVESFRDDCSIRKVSTKTLFEQERSKFFCFVREERHEKCSTLKGWEEKNPEEAEEFGNSQPARAMYMLLNREVNYKGQKLFVKGAIKSLDQPCRGKPSGLPHHSFTCHNSFKQQTYLVDLSKKRDQAVYHLSHDYALKAEMKENVAELQSSNKKLGKAVSSLSVMKPKT